VTRNLKSRTGATNRLISSNPSREQKRKAYQAQVTEGYKPTSGPVKFKFTGFFIKYFSGANLNTCMYRRVDSNNNLPELPPY